MKQAIGKRLVIIILILVVVMSACDRNSSPEGRMSIKLENLHKEMIDSLKKQNEAILDSLGKMRQEIQKLREGKKD